jgi:hypothetical protein
VTSAETFVSPLTSAETDRPRDEVVGEDADSRGSVRFAGLPDKVVRRIHPDPSGCWIWIGSIDQYGYGRLSSRLSVKRGGLSSHAHRITWTLLRGEIPEGLQIDHLCRVRRCVNPDHLEPVTPLENQRRGIAGQVVRARHLARTHCVNGHEFTPENTRIDRSRKYPRRCCKTCEVLAGRRASAKRRSGPARGPRRAVVQALPDLTALLECGHIALPVKKREYRGQSANCAQCAEDPHYDGSGYASPSIAVGSGVKAASHPPSASKTGSSHSLPERDSCAATASFFEVR